MSTEVVREVGQLARVAPGVRAEARRQWEDYAAAYFARMDEAIHGYQLSREWQVRRDNGETLPCDGDIYEMLRRWPERVALAYCSEEARTFLTAEPFIRWGVWWDDYRSALESRTENDVSGAVFDTFARYRAAKEELERLEDDLTAMAAMARSHLGISWESLEDLTGLTRNTLNRRIRAIFGRVPEAYSGSIYGD